MSDPTDLQRNYVTALQDKLHLSADTLDLYCMTRFGGPYAELDRAQVSMLLTDMTRWKAIPAELQRAMGQTDMFGGL